MATHLILGTAGHIDHGKTALIRALTGVDTDRLPEEKRRGITIDLGFAELAVGEFRLGIVDVPGHEKFVRNMVAGATGMDMALLVVAADDSVKPQTREHLAILRMLDLPAGVIALTKADLADAEWMKLVEQEVRELVAGSFLENAPLVRVSAKTGLGIPQLTEVLERAAEQASQARGGSTSDEAFRLPIDRVFTVDGHGTVVTGSVAQGGARTGDTLLLEPGGISVRVRGVQNHDRSVEAIGRGQRAAMNLAGVHHDEVRRGHELVSANSLRPSSILSAHLQLLPTIDHPLKQRSRVRLHVGTAELMANVVLLEGSALKPGARSLAQLFLAEPVVAAWGQVFILRSESPVTTLGGGQVLSLEAKKIRRQDETALTQLRELTSEDPLRRASAAAFFAGWELSSDQSLGVDAGLPDPNQNWEALRSSGTLVRLQVTPQRHQEVHRLVLERLAESVRAHLQHLHEVHPLQTAFKFADLVRRFAYLQNEEGIASALRWMCEQRILVETRRGITLPEHTVQLAEHERELLNELLSRIHAGAFQPPTLRELQESVPKNRAAVPSLLSFAADHGDVVPIAAGMYLHAEWEMEMRSRVGKQLQAGSGMTVAEIRDLLGTSRKFAVPLCEYLDRQGFTKRQGDLRILAHAESVIAGE